MANPYFPTQSGKSLRVFNINRALGLFVSCVK